MGVWIECVQINQESAGTGLADITNERTEAPNDWCITRKDHNSNLWANTVKISRDFTRYQIVTTNDGIGKGCPGDGG